MFTGIIQDFGIVTKLEKTSQKYAIFIACTLPKEKKSQLGDSISVNGVCLTMNELHDEGFAADLAPSTMSKTALKYLQLQQKVNLEVAMTLDSFLGGHLVQGHINDVAKVLNIETLTNCYILTLSLPQPLLKYCILEGSITIDGVSLTISAIQEEQISINIIPHTWAKTTIGDYQIGQFVNVEVDIIAKYMEKWLSPWLKNLANLEQPNLGGHEKFNN